MKIRIELVDSLEEDEVVIRCRRVDDSIQRIHQYILEQGRAAPKIVFYQGSEEYYFPLEDILFFETEGDLVFAHTEQQSYRTRLRLYELEEALPRQFARVSKSTIVNTGRIYSIKRELPGSGVVQFAGTHKQVYVSRHYQAELKKRMKEI